MTAWNSLGYFDPAGVTASPLVYRALLTQTGTNAPVATVLENTLGGAVVWSYNDVGIFTATLAGAFPSGKTGWRLGNQGASLDGTNEAWQYAVLNADQPYGLRIQTAVADLVNGTLALANGGLLDTFFEILVYP